MGINHCGSIAKARLLLILGMLTTILPIVAGLIFKTHPFRLLFYFFNSDVELLGGIRSRLVLFLYYILAYDKSIFLLFLLSILYIIGAAIIGSAKKKKHTGTI